MNSITLKNINRVSQEMKKGYTFLFGAGVTGQRFHKILMDLGFRIDGFIDDDPNKSDTYLNGKKIYSYMEFLELYSHKKVDVILSTIYGNYIADRLENDGILVWEMFSIYAKYYGDSLEWVLACDMSKAEWKEKCRHVETIVHDDESKDCLHLYSSYVEEEKVSYETLLKIATHEDHYFVPEVKNALPQYPVIVDCGACTGEIICQMQRHGINFAGIYCFEASPSTYQILCKNVASLNLCEKVKTFPLALWDKAGVQHFLDNTSSPPISRIIHTGGDNSPFCMY